MATEQQRKAIAVVALAETFGRNISEAGVKMYVSALEGISADAVENAVRQAAVSCRAMPPPVELRELAGEVKYSDRAELAFQALKEACSRIGAFKSPDFDDRIINATVRNMGGWQRACEMPVSEFDTWYRKEFVRIYEVFCRVGARRDDVAMLEGINEIENRAAGYLEAAARSQVKVPTKLPWAGQPVRLLDAPESRNVKLIEGSKV